MQGTQGQCCPNFGMHGLLVSLRPPSGHNGSRDIRFVAGSEKVTFDVKYSGLRPQTPADELCDGRTASSVMAVNEVAAGSKAGRIDNKAAHGVSPNQEASLGRRPKFSCSWSGTTGSPG